MKVLSLVLGFGIASIFFATGAFSFKQYTPEEFYQTVSLWGNGISTDQRKILFTSNETGIYNVYQMDIDGKNKQSLTNSKVDSIYGIRYLPNSHDFLYRSNQGGNERDHVYLQKVNGKVVDLIPKKGVKVNYEGFDRDGKHFYLSSNERDAKYMDLYRFDVKNLKRTLIFKNTDGYNIGYISPDGKWLSLSKNHGNTNGDLYIVDLTQKKQVVTHISKHKGDAKYGSRNFSIDSSYLVYSTNLNSEFTRLMKYDLKSKKHSLYYEADWDVVYASYSFSGRYRVIAINEDARTNIKLFDVKSGNELKLNFPKGNIGNINISTLDEYLSFTVSSDRQPSDLYVMNLKTNKYKKLTNSLNPKINIEHLVDSQVVRYSSFDKLKIPAILYKPQQASEKNKVPAIVWVHGGPGGQSRVGYRAVLQYLVNHGYAVLAVNNRGSSGYGKTFHHMDDRKHGDVDLKDCIWGRKYLEGLNWVDGKRVAIMGGSYGGYMTLAALAFAPDSFELGIDIFGVSNWLRTLESIPSWWEAQRKSLYDELGDPSKDKKRLTAISPLFHADKIKKPLLVVQGKNDPRVLESESSDIVKALKKNKTPVEYVLFDDEGHGFRKKDNQIKALKAYHSFLKKHL